MKKTSELEFLERLSDFGIKLGLDKTFSLLKKSGNPHLKYPSILIAGTNGKGSVSKTLSEILKKSGFKVGLYLSPHLVDIKERILINGEKIKEKDFVLEIKKIKEILSTIPYHLYPTFFEALTVIAFSYFAKEKIDILVAEVGMGGKFDATNVLPSFLEIITSISLEHTQYLGKTLSEIAQEKAGIIKQKTIVISAFQDKEVEKVIKRKAKEKKCKLYFYGKNFKGKIVQQDLNNLVFNFYGEKVFKNIKTSLLGNHQVENISLAIQSCIQLQKKGYKISEKDIYEGIENVFWPARFQILRKKPLIILDGAHNPAGIISLKKSIKAIFPKEKFSFFIGILKDKNWKEMIKKILPLTEEIIFTQPNTERAILPENLASFTIKEKKGIKVNIIPSVKIGLEKVKKSKKNFCICGSLYLAGEVLKYMGSKFLNRRI